MPRRVGQFTWDAGVARYRDWRGRFIAPTIVRRGLDRALDVRSAEMRSITDLMRQGAISATEWRDLMRLSIKDAQLYSAAAARGGFAQMTPSDFGRVGSIVQREYKYLEKFAREIASGQQPLDGTVLSRSMMYGQQGRTTYEKLVGVTERERGMDEERNILHVAEHCSDCVDMTELGWQPINTLIPIGERKCRANDRCTMQYRRRPTSAR